MDQGSDGQERRQRTPVRKTFEGMRIYILISDDFSAFKVSIEIEMINVSILLNFRQPVLNNSSLSYALSLAQYTPSVLIGCSGFKHYEKDGKGEW